MTSLNFDNDGQLGSMELYSLQLQKIVADFTDFDAVTKAYVDTQVTLAKQQLTNGASEALDTFKELEDYLTASGVAGGLVEQINALSQQITDEATRAGTEEGKLDARVSALENDTTSATGISAVQSELDATQTGAGLDHNGSYYQSVATNYINTATSLKEADDLLDQALKAEVDRAIAAEQGLASSLATAANERVSIDTAYKSADEFIRDRLVVLEADPTTQTEVNIVGNLLNELSANVTSGSAALLGDISTERAARIDGDDALSARLVTLENDPTTATAVTAIATSVTELETSVNADFTAMQESLDTVESDLKQADDALTVRIADQESKQTTDDTFAATDRANIRSELEQEVGDERVRAQGIEQGLRTDIDAQVAKQASDKTLTDEAILSETTARNAADTLLNSAIATNTANLEAQISKQTQDKTEADERHTASEAKHTTSDTRHDEHDAKHVTSDGRHDGHDTKHAEHEQNLGELESTKFDKAGGEISGEVRVNLDASYFYLSSVWRIRTDAIGKRIVFEFNKDVAANEGEGDWVSGIPFISSH